MRRSRQVPVVMEVDEPIHELSPGHFVRVPRDVTPEKRAEITQGLREMQMVETIRMVVVGAYVVCIGLSILAVAGGTLAVIVFAMTRS